MLHFKKKTEIMKIKNTELRLLNWVEYPNWNKVGYTDDIWETFQEMFEERFEHDKGMLESEFVK